MLLLRHGISCIVETFGFDSWNFSQEMHKVHFIFLDKSGLVNLQRLSFFSKGILYLKLLKSKMDTWMQECFVIVTFE